MLIHLDRIMEAYRGIDSAFKSSPHFVSDALSELTGVAVLVKDDTRNPIGSFKGRGASWWMACHPEVDRVVCASAGNFGQGMAYAGKKGGCSVQVVVSESANPVKVSAIQDLGADVITAGRDFDAAKEAARELAVNTGAVFVEDGREVEIAEGAGTIGVELARYKRGIDAVFVPIGNGALANGVGSYLKATKPEVQVIGVCAETAPAMAMSWKQGRVVSTKAADTIADGIAVRIPVPESLEILAGAVDDVILVSDAAIKGAMQLLFREEGIVTEPAGAVSLAGLLKQTEQYEGATVATLVCGANIDPEMRKRWLG